MLISASRYDNYNPNIITRLVPPHYFHEGAYYEGLENITGSIGDIPGRFESIDVTRERLKKDGIKKTASRVPKKWFVEGDQAKYYYLCENAVKNISLEAAEKALIAMKNWKGIDNLKNIKNETLIIWGDKDVSYNFDQVDILNKNIPNSKIEIFNGCSHNVHLEDSEKFNNTVKDFLL